MAKNSIELVALAIGLDTTKFRKEMEYTQRLLNQSKGAFRDVETTVRLLDAAMEQQLITEQAATAAKNKATLAVERQQEALRKEAEAVKALTLAKEKEAAANLARSQNFLGIGVGSSNTSAVIAKPIPESTRSSLDSYYNSAQAAATATKVLSDEAEKSRQAAIKSQEAFAGWSNGLRLATAQLKESRDGALAWAKGLERVAAATRAAASAASQLDRDARRGSRVALNNALDDILAGNAAKDATRDAAIQERRALRQEGLQYLRQFETRQQRTNRQLAEAAELYRRTAISANEYQNTVRQIHSNNSALVQGFNQFRGAMLTLVGPLVLLVKTWEAFKAAIRLSAELDAARAKFRVFTGSIVQAEALLQEVRQLSQTSPVSFAGGQRAVTTMLQFGVATNEVVSALKQVAEITGGDTARMESLALAYAQSAAAGRLMGQELLQMVNAGFNPLKVISEQTGVSLVDLKKKMEEGGISFRQVANAFKDATAEGGKFNGLLAEVAETTSGKFTRAISQLEQLGTALGKAIDPEVRGTLTVFTKVMQELTDVLNGQQSRSFTDSLVKDLDEARYTLNRIDSSSITAILATLGKDRDAVVKQIRDYERQLAIVKNIAKIRERIARGEAVSAEEQGIVARVDAAQRSQIKTTDGEYDALRTQLERDLKDAVTREDQLRLRVNFVDAVGDGRINDEDLKFIKLYREELKQLGLAAELATEAERVFADAIKATEEAAVESRYGNRAEGVKLLLEQSKGTERDTVKSLIDQGAAIETILAATNKAAQAEFARFETLQASTRLLEDRAKEQEKRAEQDAAFKEELKNLDSQAKYLREIVTLGKEQARIEQLMRDDGLNQVEAELQQAAEARLAAEEKIAELRKQAKDLTTNTTAFDKLVNSLSELQQLSQLGLIKDSVFSREQANLFNSQAKQTDASAPRAVQAGSSEAFALQANAQAKLISEQIRLADRAFLVQQAIAEASKKTAKVLDEVKDNLGALPTP